MAQIHVKKIHCELTIDEMEFVHEPLIIRQIGWYFGKVAAIVRAFFIDTLVDNKMTPILFRRKSSAAVRALKNQ